ncbi:MAG: hypothetical protein FWG08_02520 [Propionibacteriaceae bacterium]|nr:hypothetical protein [Propionibacteriaceae bacterium]
MDSHQVTGFGHKLDYLKSLVRATDGEIGNSVGVVASLVCRWRSGERTLDRGRDGRMLGNWRSFSGSSCGHPYPGLFDLVETLHDLVCILDVLLAVTQKQTSRESLGTIPTMTTPHPPRVHSCDDLTLMMGVKSSHGRHSEDERARVDIVLTR